MTIERKIVNEENLTMYTARGEITREDIKLAIQSFYEQGPVTKNVLWNVSQADLKGLRAEDVQQIVQVPRRSMEKRKGGKTAIVAPGDLAYGLSRVYQASSQADSLPFEMRVFRDNDSARAWLTNVTARIE